MHSFVYCEWIDRERLEKSLPQARFICKGTLADHRLAFVDFVEADGSTGTGGCHLEREDGATVPGLVYEFDAASVETAERLSRVPQGRYRRYDVNVAGEDGQTYEAAAYVIADPVGVSPPSEEYRANMLAGAKAWSFPDPYVAELAQL
jgi:AIG2-like family